MDTVKRVVGIDPGLNITGYGVIEFTGIDDIRVIEAGVIRGGASKTTDGINNLGQRLNRIHDGVREVIETLQPYEVALEELYSHYERPQTAILMGHARGVICLAAASAAIDIHHYSATQIKRVLTGNGRAPKSQMQMAVAQMLKLETVPEPPDVADALAIAVCHCFLGQKTASRIQ